MKWATFIKPFLLGTWLGISIMAYFRLAPQTEVNPSASAPTSIAQTIKQTIQDAIPKGQVYGPWPKIRKGILTASARRPRPSADNVRSPAARIDSICGGQNGFFEDFCTFSYATGLKDER